MKYLLCLLLEWHTPESEPRTGESVGRTRNGDRFLFQFPMYCCRFCGEIIQIGDQK